MPATIHDVAKRANVGIGTVSSVLNNSRPVNEETRQRVLKAIAELNFVPNSSGRVLSTGKTNMIGVVIPYFSTPSQVERLRGIMSVLAESDYDVSLFTIETIAQRNKILKAIPRQGRIDGLIICSIDLTEDDLTQISQKGVPTVLVESRHPDLHSIYLDDAKAAQNAVEYLIKLGHRKIAYISDVLNDVFGSQFGRHRYEGYRQALKEAGIPFESTYHSEGRITREAARQMAHQLLDLADPPTAIFAYSDVQAIGVLEAARERNIRVPEDLSVVGYDDIELAYFAQLTTVRQKLYESGVEGVNVLLSTMENPNQPPISIKLSTQLIIRQTTAPPVSV